MAHQPAFASLARNRHALNGLLVTLTAGVKESLLCGFVSTFLGIHSGSESGCIGGRLDTVYRV